MAAKEEAGADIIAGAQVIAAEMVKHKIKLDNGATGEALQKKAADGAARLLKIAGLRKDLDAEIDGKNAVLKEIQALEKKIRQGVVGKFGDDSDEYAAVGGTKTSERKPAGRRAKKPVG